MKYGFILTCAPIISIIKYGFKVQCFRLRSITKYGYPFKVSSDEREDPYAEPYQLEIIVLYRVDDRCPDADEQAISCCNEIDELFASVFYVNGCWQGIEVVSCEPISDEALSVAVHDTYKQWRLEYLSKHGDRDDAFPFYRS